MRSISSSPTEHSSGCILGVGIVALAVAMPMSVRAQTAAAVPGWSFSLTPYLWLPTIDTSVRYRLPNQVEVGTDSSVSPGDYISKLHFATAFAAEARDDRVSVLTDFMYVSLSGEAARIKSVDIAAVPANPISRAQTLHLGASLQTAIWNLAGAYTLFRGTWGTLDMLAGFRLAAVTSTADYDLDVQFFGPRGQGSPVFGGSGRLSASQDVWNGIVGVRGRIALGQSHFYLPYYLDVGAGDSRLTWETQVGVGYRAGWADLSVGYRYLSFQQRSSAPVRKLSERGAIIDATFRF